MDHDFFFSYHFSMKYHNIYKIHNTTPLICVKLFEKSFLEKQKNVFEPIN